MNTVIISGNLTADPELRYVPSGSAVSSFNVAINSKWRDKAGELKEEVSFIGCVAFGKTAETICQYMQKGSKVLISGKLKQESWEDKQTQQKRSKTVVVVDSFEFMGGKSDAPKQDRPAPKGEGGAMEPGKSSNPNEEDDVPFHHPPRPFNFRRLA